MQRRTTFAANGRQRRGNPIGRDGQPLKCHRCGSTDHLQTTCHLQPRSHNAIADFEFTTASLSARAFSLDQAIQQYCREAPNYSFGIDCSLDDSPTPLIHEVIEEEGSQESDPFQQDDPWSNSHQPRTYEILPTQVIPTPGFNDTDSVSNPDGIQNSAAPVAVEATTTTTVSPLAGEEELAAPRPSGS